MINKLKTLSFALIAMLMAACSGIDRGDDVRSELLGFVPDKTQVIISINPQKMLRSAGGDWTEADGIVRGPYIDDLLDQIGERVKLDENVDTYLKIKGLNPESVIVASGNNFNSWYMLGAVSDKNLLTDYLSTVCDVEIENVSGFDAVNLKGAWLLIDDADQLLWMVTERDSDDAVRFVKNIKSRAADKPMPKWAHNYLGSGDNFFSAMGNFSAMGVNLNGLMRMMNIPADLLGGDISYLVLSAGESGHKASGHLMTLDADGKNVPLFNERFYKSADLLAWNMLPDACESKFALGISGKEVMADLPILRTAIDDNLLVDAVEALQSIAMGVGSVDYSALEHASDGVATYPVKNGAVVAKFAPGKSAELLKFIASNVPGIETVDNNTLKLDMAQAKVKGLDALYFHNSNDALIVSADNAKPGNRSESLPSNTLAYSYSNGKVYGTQGPMAFASEMLKSATGSWDADGMHTEAVYTDKCPGTLAMVIKTASVYIAEMNKIQKEQAALFDELYDDEELSDYEPVSVAIVDSVE
ncbi:MAG: hypothetical protein K2I19_02330 [Muribaculaceae bacterium]|nr:hypothetical protein [Muribaculaceae bacterium]